MELHPASPSLIGALRTGGELTAEPVAEVRPVVAARPAPARAPAAAPADEVLIPDDRAGLTPAQSVERKLSVLLRGGSIPASHFRMAKLCRKR